MRLDEIDALPSFALLGPGFTGDGFVLCGPLSASRGAGTVAFLPYEASPSELESFDGPLQCVELGIPPPRAPLHVTLNSEGHAQALDAIRASIAAGDVYQVNLTLRARVTDASPVDLFTVLCRRGVPRFAAWVRLPDGTEFVSASPELFFEVTGQRIRCEPMKGTATVTAGEALLSSEKDAAELAMITDLIRNDLTPLCEPRSVRVVEERRFIHLPYAVQTVSDIEGTLLPSSDLNAILTSLHPGGSITGAPKQAARELIAALESSPRNAYCGTLGFTHGDRSTFSLLIRTAQRDGRDWIYGVGGGVVWDSTAEKELEEIHVKLGALR